jgi:hypothetical protein
MILIADAISTGSLGPFLSRHANDDPGPAGAEQQQLPSMLPQPQGQMTGVSPRTVRATGIVGTETAITTTSRTTAFHGLGPAPILVRGANSPTGSVRRISGVEIIKLGPSIPMRSSLYDYRIFEDSTPRGHRHRDRHQTRLSWNNEGVVHLSRRSNARGLSG